jgi:uncharacterized repeat protein (TIGR01451 family)
MQISKRISPHAAGLAAILAIALAGPASAQVQRTYVNSSFEVPALTAANNANGCYLQLSSDQVPGWSTTHPVRSTEGNCTSPTPIAGTLIELWRTNFQGVVSRDGLNFAELNAAASSRIYQNVCLINGEDIRWRFSHRGRSSSSVRDVMEYKIGASSTIVRVGTTSNGSFDTPTVIQGTANAPASGGGGWVDYSGSFRYGGATGGTNMGFESISTAGGGLTSGNFLDNIHIDLAPFVEFTQASSSSPEATGGNLPTLRVNGTVTTAFTVTVQITGGTATLGTDYTTPGNSTTLTINVPVGTYDGVSSSSLFALPVTITNDASSESNETIVFTILPPPVNNPPFLLASSATCGGAVQTTWTYTIVDDDASISLSKNAAAPVPVAGNAAQADVVYTIVASNPSATTTARYSLVDSPAFDADTSIVSASYRRNGGGATTLPAATPWTLQPQWRALAPCASDTYVVTVRVNVNRGGSVGNDSCASPSTPGNGLHNAVRAVVQGSGGNPDANFDAHACQATPTPVWVTLSKQLQGRVVATDQAQVRIFSGGISAASATTSGSTLPASASTGVIVLPAGNVLQFEEAIKTNGTGADRALTGYRPSISCANSGTSSPGLPTGPGVDAGNRQQWPEFSPAAGADLDCTITNALRVADLRIVKTNDTDSVVFGSPVTYRITVSNDGPDAADGAVLRDPAPTSGLQDCALAAAPACTASGGAACPATGAGAGQLSIANLQGAGVVLPTLPNGGSVTVSVTCTVQ